MQTGSALSIPLLLNGMKLSAMARPSFFRNMNGDSDRVLVLIQLNGGNDGLNTIIPVDQYSQLFNVRENLMLPETSLLSIEDTVALHPSMSNIRNVYNEGKMTILQSVGYPNQNRSHFRSTDIWTTASEADEFLTTGWVGRHFDVEYPGFPDAYPNDDCPDPFAITLGNIVSETCQGIGANFSLAFTDPFALSPITEVEAGSVPDNHYGNELTFLRTAISQTNAYTTVVQDAATAGNNMVTYPDNNFANQLKTVANLISGGLRTQVYIVNLGGFDTHANQVANGDTLNGDHAGLLNILSEGVEAFLNDLQQLGLDERVLSMTFSEFGRRIRSNDSFGTDHGTAAPLMLFGTCVNPGILGDNPEIPDNPSTQEGVPMQFDFRSIYGSVLQDWFGVPEAQVRNLLYDDYQYLPILKPCSDTTSTKDVFPVEDNFNSYHFPSPFTNQTTIAFDAKSEQVKLSVFDDLGHEIKVLVNQKLSAGHHQFTFDASGFPAGHYYYHIQTRTRQKTKLMIKVNS